MSATILLAPALVSLLTAPEEPPKSAELEDAARPKLGMQVRSVEVDTGPDTYRLTERSSEDVVRAILVGGAAVAIVGGRARRRLDAARRAYDLGPQLSQGGGGLTLGGRS